MRIVRQGFTFNSSSMFEEVTEDTGWLSLGSVKVEDGSDFTDEEGLEGAGCVVPSETLAIPVPQLEAVLLFPVLVLEVVRLTSVPVLVCHRLPR